MKYCKWKRETDNEGDFFKTSCTDWEGLSNFVSDDHSIDDKFVFCPYCGKKIKENKNESSGI